MSSSFLSEKEPPYEKINLIFEKEGYSEWSIKMVSSGQIMRGKIYPGENNTSALK